MDDIIKGIKDIAEAVFTFILDNILMDSPFKGIALPKELNEIMGYVNYYIPFGGMVTLGVSWLMAYIVYMVWRIVLKKIDAVK